MNRFGFPDCELQVRSSLLAKIKDVSVSVEEVPQKRLCQFLKHLKRFAEKFLQKSLKVFVTVERFTLEIVPSTRDRFRSGLKMAGSLSVME